jgi:methionyl aminopeptidase
MVVLKTTRELALMREACAISAGALKAAGEAVEPGVTTAEIDRIVHDYIVKRGAEPAFLNYNGFPAATCISINEEVIHGIPSQTRIVRNGDLVSIDLGARFNGYVGDNAATYAAGDISPEAQRLSNTTKESLYEGIRVCGAGGRIGDIGAAIARYCEQRGFSVVAGIHRARNRLRVA